MVLFRRALKNYVRAKVAVPQVKVTSGTLNYQVSSGQLAKQYKRYTNTYNQKIVLKKEY